MSEGTLLSPAPAPEASTPAPEATPQPEQTTPEQIITPADDRDWTTAINQDGTFTDVAYKYGIPEQWKSPGAILESYKDLQRMKGAPGEEATPEQLSAYRQANGVPEIANAESYGIEIPGEMKDIIPAEGLNEIVKVANESAHLGHTAMLKAVVSKFGEIETAARAESDKATAEERQEKLAESAKMLESDPNFQGDRKTAALQTAANGLNSALEALGETSDSEAAQDLARNPLAVRILHHFASKMGQDATNLGAPISDLRSGEEQADDIINNPSNPLYKAYHEGDKHAQQKVLTLMGTKAKI